MLKILGCLQRILLDCSWERTHPACGELETLSTLEACAPRDLCALSGREKKCSAGFQPAKGPVDTKRVIQAHMPARRRRYVFSHDQRLRGGIRFGRGSALREIRGHFSRGSVSLWPMTPFSVRGLNPELQ